MACVLQEIDQVLVPVGIGRIRGLKSIWGKRMRPYTYIPLAMFFIIISVTSKVCATAITDLQDIIDWLSVTFTESGSPGFPDQYGGFNSEEWDNG